MPVSSSVGDNVRMRHRFQAARNNIRDIQSVALYRGRYYVEKLGLAPGVVIEIPRDVPPKFKWLAKVKDGDTKLSSCLIARARWAKIRIISSALPRRR